jgi:hypothetical protein
MKTIISILSLIAITLYALSVFAQTKVVVVPLGGGVEKNQTCPENSYMTGIDIQGKIVCESAKYVFVTSTVHSGNLGGLVGADVICQNLADAAGLPGIYLAWLSDSDRSPSTRFTRPIVPYVNTIGETVAAGWNDLIDGQLTNTIGYDENGVANGGVFWSGTDINGNVATIGWHCLDWTSDSNSQNGQEGVTSYTDAHWTSLFGDSCDNNDRHLVCFQQ